MNLNEREEVSTPATRTSTEEKNPPENWVGQEIPGMGEVLLKHAKKLTKKEIMEGFPLDSRLRKSGE